MLMEMRRWNTQQALPDKTALNLRDAATADVLRRLWAGRRVYHEWLGVWRHFAGWEGTFLDVGANVGQSIVSFAQFNPRMTIWAFEPNPHCADSIAFAAGLVPNAVHVFLCGLADESGMMPLHVPVVRGNRSFGPVSNASLRRSELDKAHIVRRLLGAETDRDALSIVEIPASLRRLDDIGDPPDLRIVKIDVEGFERRVLEGITPAIRRHRPVMTVERNNWAEIAAWMAREGYRAFDYRFEDGLGRLTPDPIGKPGRVVDAVLLPTEGVEKVLSAATALVLDP